jgi:hypothetical protein
VLVVLLVAWEPVTLSVYASGVVDRVIERGALATLVLLARVVVAAVGIAAGLALWNDRPRSVAFARLAVILSAAATLLAAVTRALPTGAPPGVAGPLLALTLAWDAAWIAYLTWWLRRPLGPGDSRTSPWALGP